MRCGARARSCRRAPGSLHRGFLTRDTSDDDVTLRGGGLALADHEVTVEDPDVDHRFASHSQHEQLAVAGEVGRHRDDLFDVLGGEHIGAGGDIADERDMADGRRSALAPERPS